MGLEMEGLFIPLFYQLILFCSRNALHISTFVDHYLIIPGIMEVTIQVNLENRLAIQERGDSLLKFASTAKLKGLDVIFS
mmetsp:Transcript_17634/g.12565  ORF Transcript_17634/g.12565 Transcript_17634/m.12565 type:complete len:80 (-) Transcript_17634:338-577(-)